MSQVSKSLTLAAPQDLRIFLAISKAHTLSEAARDLELPLSTVNRALKRIQTSMNVTLVHQHESGLDLTEIGRQYVAACINVLEAHRQADDVLLHYRKQASATINISVPIIFAAHVLSPVIYDFLLEFPKSRIDLALYDSHWDREPNISYDLWLRISPSGEERDHLTLLPGIRQGLFASPRYLADHTGPKNLCSLAEHACLGYDRTGVLWPWHFARKGTTREIHPDFYTVATDPLVLAHLAVEGAGIALLPIWLAHKFVLAEKLVPLLSEWNADPLVFCICRRARFQKDSRVDVLIESLYAIVGTERDPRCQGVSPSTFFV